MSLLRRPWTRTLAATAALALAAGALAAHDFWIVPGAFALAPGDMLEIRGQTSTRFPTSVSAVVPERLADARIVSASGEDRLTDFSVSGTSLVIRHRPTSPGQLIVAVGLVPRSARTTPARLKNYIALEGAPQLAERYEREGLYPRTDSLTQTSSKFAKTMVEVGRGGPRAFARAVGHPLELVPVNDPAMLRAGDTLVVRLLYRGQPVAGAHLHGSPAPAGLTVTSDTAQARVATWNDVAAETGPDGTARMALATSGLWNVRGLHAAPVTPASSSSLPEWEALFVTLVFNVSARQGR